MSALSVGKIGLDLIVNKNGFDRQMSGIQGLAKKAGAALAAAFAVKKIAAFGKKCLELGSDLAEVQNVVDVTFTSMSGKMDGFAKRAVRTAGLSETMAKQYAGTFGAMAKSFGFAEKDAYTMSTALTQLAGDVASFYNLSQDEAYTKLKSVFTGETETLKDLGVVMTQTALDQYALSNGIGKTVQQMSEYEKVALRYKFVTEQLSGASGDFLRTSDGWANQVRILKLQFDSLKATLGQGLINVFTPVIKAVNALLGRLATLAGAFKSFTELITGNKSSGAGSGISALAGAAAETSAGLEGAAGAADNLADNTSGVGKAAKKAAKEMKALMGFDQISKISEPSGDDAGDKETGSSGITPAIQGGPVDLGSLAEGDTVLDRLGGKFQGLIDRAKELAGLFKKGFFEGLGNPRPILEDLKNDIISIGQSLKEIFTDPEVLDSAKDFSDQLALTLGQVTGSAANIGLTIASNLVGGLERYLSQNKERIKNYIVGMLDVGEETLKTIGDLSVAIADIFSTFGSGTAQQITGNLIGVFAEVAMLISENAAKLGRDILDMIAQPIIDNKEKIKDAIEGTLGAIEPFTSGLLDVVQKVRDAITEIYDQHLKPLFDSVASGLSEIFGKLLDGYNTYMIPVLGGLGDKFKELMDGPFGGAIDKIKEFVGKLIDALKVLWEEVLVPLFGWIAENIMPILSDIIDFVGTTVMDAIKIIVDAIGNIASTLGGLIDFIVGIFTGDWEKAWGGLKDIVDGMLSLIKDIFSDTWDMIKEMTEKATEAISGVVSVAWDGIKSLTSTVWNAIKNIVSSMWNIMKSLATTVFNAIRKAISTAWNAIKITASTVWKAISGSLSSAWKGIKSTASTVFDGIRDTISNVWNSLKTTTSRAWDGIKGVIRSPINAIIGMINGLLSGVQTMQNGIAGALNNLRIDIPDWLQGITGYSSFGFNIPPWTAPQISYLAEGGFVKKNTPQLAMIGDNRHQGEVVAPEGKLQEMVDAAVRAAGSGITRQELEAIIDSAVLRIVAALEQLGFYVDSEELARAVKKGERRRDMRYNPVMFN